MIIVGFCNLKGGVGKTTACQNIAAALVKAGRKIAVIDMDPQSNLSEGFGVTPEPTEPQVFDLLAGGAEWDDIVRHKEGVDIIPSSLNLVMAELNNEGPLGTDTALRNALKKVDPDRYDYILLDSPPQLGIFTRNVLAACDKIIVPMDGGFYSLFGLRLLNNSLSILSEKLGNKLEIMGILLTNYNPRLYIARKIFEEVKKNYGDKLFESYIRQSVSLVEASSMGMSIFAYSPKSKGADFYREVAAEFVKRLEGEEKEIISQVPEKVVPVKIESEVEEVDLEEAPAETLTTSELSETETPKVPEILEREVIEELLSPVAVEPANLVEKVEEVNEVEPAPDSLTAYEETPEPSQTMPTSLAGPYEESIKQSILELLPPKAKTMWAQMLAPITDITRDEIDVRTLREDFEDCDKDRYTFYILNDESETFWPVMYPDQIIEPLRCVIKWDENGSAEVYM